MRNFGFIEMQHVCSTSMCVLSVAMRVIYIIWRENHEIITTAARVFHYDNIIII